MYIRKVLLISKLALALLLCYVIAKVVSAPLRPREIFTPSSASAIQQQDAVKTTAPEKVSVKDYSAIIEHNIFSGAAPSATVDTSLWHDRIAGLLQSAEKELGLILLGTICGSKAVSRAVTKDIKDDQIGLYKTGDTVADATVESIEKDAVILLHNGQKKILRLHSPNGSGGEENQQAPVRKIVEQNSETVKIDLQAEQAHEEVQTKAGHIETMLRKAVIEPYQADGQMEGIRVTGLENVPAAKDLGLRNGDVIRSVNGQRLTSKQKAFQVFMKARTQPTMDVELLREGKTKELSFVLR